jgi:hypothetical protein
MGGFSPTAGGWFTNLVFDQQKTMRPVNETLTVRTIS